MVKIIFQLLLNIVCRTLHNYILWRLVMSITPHMIDEYQQKRIEFRRILLGILTERARWSQCVEWTNKKLGMAVGALFIRENFNHESKVTSLYTLQEFQVNCHRFDLIVKDLFPTPLIYYFNRGFNFFKTELVLLKGIAFRKPLCK